MTELTIACDIPEWSHVDVTLFDTHGKQVRTLYTGYHDAGLLTVTEGIQDLRPGLYLCRVWSRYYRGSAKFLVVR